MVHTHTVHLPLGAPLTPCTNPCVAQVMIPLLAVNTVGYRDERPHRVWAFTGALIIGHTWRTATPCTFPSDGALLSPYAPCAVQVPSR